MTKCNFQTDLFAPVNSKKIAFTNEGASISSDAGLLLLRELDKKLNFSKKIASCIPDTRDKSRVTHSLETLVRQRIYALSMGYEDYNDHDEIRKDVLMQSAVDQDDILAGKSTICRLEQAVRTQEVISKLDDILVDLFIQTRRKAPTELILDFDATDTRLYGDQEGKHFHGYYGGYCYLPLLVFTDDFPLHAGLRTSDSDPAQGTLPVLIRLVTRLRMKWPDLRLTFRADAGFCRDQILSWCEENDVFYIVGYSNNSKLARHCEDLAEKVKQAYQESGKKAKHFSSFDDQAGTWSARRRVLVKAEHNPLGPNMRFVVTNLKGGAEHLYNEVYCARGDMENRIKEQQTDLFGYRMSSKAFVQNAFRFLMSTFAYVLVNQLRVTALRSTELAKSYCRTIREKLLKIGAVVVRNTRSLKVYLSGCHPNRELFRKTALLLSNMTT